MSENSFNTTKSDTSVSRVLYFDILRVLSICAVIWVHIAAQNFHSVPLHSFTWQVFNVFDAAGRWTVPVLVMISGALFLNSGKSLDIRKLFTRNILRVVTAFLFWSGIYALYQYVCGMSLTDSIQAFLTGHYHMWYLFLIAALYILTPVLKEASQNKLLVRYILVVSAISSFMIPQLFVILTALNIPGISSAFYYLQQTYQTVMGYLPTGYIFYFLMGNCLANCEISIKHRKILYIAGVVSFFATIILSSWYSGVLGYADSSFYSEISVNIAVMSVTFFVFGKYELSKLSFRGKALKLLLHMSKCCFGMYLAHDLFIMVLNNHFHLNTLSFHPLVSIPFIFFLVFGGSYAASALLNKIPFINKYIC